MPGYLLHKGATVVCLHTGRAEPALPCQRVKVGGQNVSVVGSLYTITGCVMPAPPSGNGPCVSATWITTATRVRACGQPVLLQDSQALCAPTGTGVTVCVTQMRVKGK